MGGGLAALVAALLVGHLGLVASTTLEPPQVSAPKPTVSRAQGVRRAGASWRTRRGRIHEMALVGSPERIGAAHAALARDLMIGNERFLQAELRRYLPSWLTRVLVMDAVRVRNRRIEESFRPERLAEIAAEARGMAPDPFDSFLPTYQRLLWLHALYDTALAFEASPVLGCSAFVASGRATADGHTWIGRNFDAELGEPFDRDKIVIAVREDGKIPFVSVAFAGMSGVLTGLNAEGIWASVNGARAGEPREDGVPVTEILREVLETSRTLDEALVIAGRRRPMVSHLALFADGKTGESAVLERSPERSATVRGTDTLLVTNHYRSSLSEDPKDAQVRETSTTLDRLSRLEERVAEATSTNPETSRGEVGPEVAISILRDRRGPGDTPLRIGDRRALDALIATHSVVADATAGVLWVSEGPHALGRYVRFDLAEILRGSAPAAAPLAVTVPADPLLLETSRMARRR